MPPPSIHKELRQIKKWERSAPNRLKSIEEDAVRCDRILTNLCWEIYDSWEAFEKKRLAKPIKSEAPRAPEDAVNISTAASSSEEHNSNRHRECPLKVRCFANLRCGEWYLPSHSVFRGGKGLPNCTTHLPNEAAGILWGAAVGYAETKGTSIKVETSPNVYFKSADSHYGKWQFSAVRLNLQLLEPYLVDSSGESLHSENDLSRVVSVVVDATQQGKRFPDALSKTVPIWCLVVNEALYYRETEHNTLKNEPDSKDMADGEEEGSEHVAQPSPYFVRARSLLPPSVPDSEVNSIAQLLPSFINTFKKQIALNGSRMANKRLARPLRPAWVSCADETEAEKAISQLASRCVQRSKIGGREGGEGKQCGYDVKKDDTTTCSTDFDTILLLCASGDTTKVRPRAGWFYVTGGADDHESWGRGLSPSLYWDNVMSILHPQGLTAPMPADVVINSLMQEVIDAHAQRCKQLAAGADTQSPSHASGGGQGSTCASQPLLAEGLSLGKHRVHVICSRVVVHCGPLGEGAETCVRRALASSSPLSKEPVTADQAVLSFLVVGPSSTGSETQITDINARGPVDTACPRGTTNDGDQSTSHSSHCDGVEKGHERSCPALSSSSSTAASRILFDVSNKRGLQRAAFALFVAATYKMLLTDEEDMPDDVAEAKDRRLSRNCTKPTLVISVAVEEHMPIAVGVLSLLMALMTSPANPEELRPLLPIARRVCSGAEEGEGVGHLAEADLRRASGVASLEEAIAGCKGALSEAIAAASPPVSKEWIRSCHQRASTLCGGITAPRSLMQQINQYFLTMDTFGKNVF